MRGREGGWEREEGQVREGRAARIIAVVVVVEVRSLACLLQFTRYSIILMTSPHFMFDTCDTSNIYQS